ncbi:hypothetical protein Tsubulata_021677 [Turnera subulata]|uniref:Uncharacterized protein n=1 Tax=Turnera subulata TaxID=218843 RepID=A0A9Q0J6F5_9ROSI|nr:hypothetical protein Tsubulata_021677 [Turnera subulata]
MRPISDSYPTHEKRVLPTSPPAAAIPPRSPWHSPVPYLFGGLAAMLGLIAFALLILACSYWRLSSRDGERGSEEDRRDIENGNGKDQDGKGTADSKVYEEKILVIMAGQEKPTFLATPVSGRAGSFADNTAKSENKLEGEETQNGDKTKEEMSNNNESTTTRVGENRETRMTQQTQEEN